MSAQQMSTVQMTESNANSNSTSIFAHDDSYICSNHCDDEFIDSSNDESSYADEEDNDESDNNTECNNTQQAHAKLHKHIPAHTTEPPEYDADIINTIMNKIRKSSMFDFDFDTNMMRKWIMYAIEYNDLPGPINTDLSPPLKPKDIIASTNIVLQYHYLYYAKR